MISLDFLDAAQRQAASLERLSHRPWPPPQRAWTMGQTWDDLLFAHWRLPAEALQPLLPHGLALDTFDGTAWIGVTPFRVSGLRLRGLLPLPGVSSFPELNVRTYVTAQDRPGIWFFSLDASSRLAVEAARLAYRLPYFQAEMRASRSGPWISYACERTGEPARAFSGRYGPAGEVFEAQPGSLEHFLAERYCLYAVGDGGALHRAEIHHGPWQLQPARAEIELNTMAPVEQPDGEPLCHFSRRQDVVIWPLERLGA